MSFFARLGLSLLFFGALTLIAQLFGYAPRKLANFSPNQLRGAGVAFLVLGGLCFALGGNPRFRRAVMIGLGSLLGLTVLIVATVLFSRFGRRHFDASPPRPAQPPSWTPPGPGAPTVSSPVAATAGNSDAQSMKTMYETRRLWETRHGRDQTWSVVVHLAGREPPADLESSLRGLAEDPANGGAVVARTGGIVHATIAPLTRPEALRTALTGLFPGADIQLTAQSRQAVVFVRQR